jgi:hypothetical protein
MGVMQIFHYTNEPFELEIKKYEEDGLNFFRGKPRGLWVSVEDESFGESNYNWKEWCEVEKYEVQNLKCKYEIKFKPNANLLILSNYQELKEFTIKYHLLYDQSFFQQNLINWHEVIKDYDGILIYPYIWEGRMSVKTQWYYGWDFSSLCIWDLNCIDSFELVQE